MALKRDTILWAALIGLLAFYFREPIVTTVKKLARGIRNHNPGNIERTGTAWRGMSADQSGDPRFIVFKAPEWGIRAMARILRTGIGQGEITVRKIINAWAPPKKNGVIENDTGAYVAAVAKKLGVSPDATINVNAALPGLISAIIAHENGFNPYSAETIAEGIRLSLA